MCDCLKSIALFVVFLVSTGIVFRNAKETFIWLRESRENVEFRGGCKPPSRTAC